MTEHDLGQIVSNDPDIARALAIFSHAKEEASKLVTGEDNESLLKRAQLQSALTRELIERSGLNTQNGKLSTDKEIFAAGEAAL
jgi:uncharacterized protein (DUF2336 family)